MDSSCFPDWNTEAGLDQFPFPTQRKPLGLDSELVELLWQNGEVVLQSQTHRSQSHDYDPSSKHKQVTKTIENPSNVIQDEVTVSWIDESFEKEFCSNFLSEDKIQDFSPITLPPPRFEAFRKPCNNESYSVRTMGSSHCASNQVVNEEVNVGPRDDSMEERETFGQPMVTMSSSGGSDSSLGKTSSQSNETNTHKRKSRDGGDSECKSDATELESAAANKSSQKARRSRVAEVHNLSERRRRDRINEKLKALQELIPHSNKLDKASILDEAIEYVKSLQSQLQLMWMGSGMASMMVPGMQQYMSSRAGMGMGMLPAMQNLISLSSRLPSVNAAQTPIAHRLMLNYQNQMRNPMFHANYMPFHPIPNNSQAINMFNFNSHSAQQNQALAPPGHGNGSIG